MSENKSNVIQVKCQDEKRQAKLAAQTYTNPAVNSAASIKGQYSAVEKLNVNELIKELEQQAEKINSGNLERAETMLISQAHCLDSLMADMMFRSRCNMNQYMDASMKYMNMALKAQNQCRMTLRTLAEIKNPRPYIQNNKAQYQQVNNNFEPSSAEEKSKATNELLEDRNDEWLDTRKAQETIRDDKEMEAMET